MCQRIVGQLQDQKRALQFEELVQIVTMTDDGDVPIGIKRNALMQAAQGDYLVFVDDDDRVSKDYIPLIVKLLESKPDCVQMHGEITVDGVNPKPFYHSIQYRTWSENDKAYFRPPAHLNPIRSNIAKQFLFPPVRKGEDYEWSMAIANSGLLKVEEPVDRILYFYDYKSTK